MIIVYIIENKNFFIYHVILTKTYYFIINFILIYILIGDKNLFFWQHAYIHTLFFPKLIFTQQRRRRFQSKHRMVNHRKSVQIESSRLRDMLWSTPSKKHPTTRNLPFQTKLFSVSYSNSVNPISIPPNSSSH